MYQPPDNTYYAIGIMSGSSLDGLDIALCKFEFTDGKVNHNIITAECIVFNSNFTERLRNATTLSGKNLWHLHSDLGVYIGKQVKAFIQKHNITEAITCVASHGHTVFHHPEAGFTTQIGSGADIAVHCGITTVCDLRSTDVALGGTGAPIVPIADRMLFNEYDFCLNLGGIANITAKASSRIVAFDISPCNQLLDFYAAKAGKPYDDDGAMAKTGKTDFNVLNQLFQLPYHRKYYPKSLDNSFSKTEVLPLLETVTGSLENKLRTVTEYVAVQVATDIDLVAKNLSIDTSKAKVLVTGGGAFNSFLIKSIQNLASVKLIVPDQRTVKFKEATAMALMGILRLRGEENVFSTVTNAKRNSINGAVYLP